jgi:L,D-peptidoglycan transpeptidase YkuD (ErfK/YbiS/YcfS/YnhG family)
VVSSSTAPSAAAASIRDKRKGGDGATPIGSWRMRRLFYRADRLQCRTPGCRAPTCALRTADATPHDTNHNQSIDLRYRTDAEALCRKDCFYDLIAPLGQRCSRHPGRREHHLSPRRAAASYAGGGLRRCF